MSKISVRTFKRRVFRLSIALLMLFGVFGFGCTSVGQYRVEGVSLKDPASKIKGTVLIVVVEGIRQDVFQQHLRSLTRSDNEPNWRSGLSLLALDGFKFASSDRAEGPIGASALTSAASLATGVSPGSHGVVGARFIDRSLNEPEAYYDFSSALHSSGIWYTDQLNKPSLETPPLLTELTRAPSWISELAQVVPFGTAYHPYGLGTDWHVPNRRTVGSLALIDSPTGALAVPLLDRAGQKSGSSLLLNGRRVVLIPFRQGRSDSCHRSNASCDVSNATLIQQQALALRSIDEALWEIIVRYRYERPKEYEKATVLLVGTHGVIDRAPDTRPNTVHLVSEDRLRDHIGAHMTDQTCIRWFKKSAVNDLRFVLDGAISRVYLPRCSPGQCAKDVPRTCLAKAVQKMTQDTQWLAGAMWLEDTSVDGRPRGAKYRVALRPAFGASIRAYRRDRLVTKMRRAAGPIENGRIGDAVLFASSRWTFGDAQGPAYAHEGGLADAAMNIPFFIANRSLTDAAPSSIRTAPLELMDIGPTIYSLLGLTPPSNRFTRPPVVRWRDGKDRVLEFVKADRKLAAPLPYESPQLTYSEGDTFIAIGLSEPKKHWPPDKLELALGDARHHWDPETNAFPPDAPCTVQENDTTRQWSCRFTVDRGIPQTLTAVAKRTPAPDADTPLLRRNIFTPGYGEPTLHEASVSCADSESVQLKLRAEDAGGLARVDVYWARSTDTERTLRGRRGTSIWLGGDASCSTRMACIAKDRPKSIDGAYTVALSASVLQHLRWSDRLIGAENTNRRLVRRAWTGLNDTKPKGPAPVSDWLVARICNGGQRCTMRRLSTDALYEASLTSQCPANN